MKTLFLPLDERPCNRVYPGMVAASASDIELMLPPAELLGRKREPADTAALADFLLERAAGVDAAVISLDMLVYGGLIPSRLHHLDYGEARARLGVLSEMRRRNPALKVYAFQCIMRAPSYDSAEEEPEYYGEYGYRLFRRKYLEDYDARHGLDEDGARELAAIDIPQDIIADYEDRRAFNLRMNLEALDYLERGDIDFLVIPQDDASPYGYTAIAQKTVIAELRRRRLDGRTMIYPGADEVGLSLLARAYVERSGKVPSIYPLYASVLGSQIVPNYEDRPMFESLKSHVRVCGARFAYTPSEADLILAINCPGKVMQESFVDAADIDVTYTSYRQLGDFVERIAEFVRAGKPVGLCDSAFSNGGDLQLIRQLDERGLLPELASYAGWNTNCNSLGTALSQMIIGGRGGAARERVVANTCYHIIEDGFYQAQVRREVVDTVLPGMGLSYYDFKDRQADVERAIQTRLQERFDALTLVERCPVRIERVYMPWHRMFEIGLDIECDPKRED